MAGNTSTIDLKVTGIAEIKKQLRELKGELASATDPQQMAELAEKAGELSDQLKDANERVSVFASGSPFEKTNNALGLMGSQLMSLDFEGAAESSKLFASAAKGINGDVIAKSLKGLGTVVVQVGKAFMSVGLSLLTNPIFLIAAAIAAIVAIIVLLMNKLGILKPILDAIGKVFGWIMDIIDGVIQGFRMLTDWLGLTANAAEDSAKRQIAASEKTLETLEKTSEENINSMDHQIRLAKIAGEDVAIAEAKKQKYIIQTTQIRIQELEKQIKIHEKLGDLEAEDLKKLKDSLAEQKKALREAGEDFEALRAENKKKVEENAKKVEENRKKVWSDQKKAAEDNAKDRLAALRQIQDLELELMDEGTAKELKANKLKYQRLIEDTLSNEKLKQSEKDKIVSELRMLESAAREEINNKEIQAEKDKQAKINQVIKDAQLLRDQEQEDFDQLYRENTLSKEQLEIDAVNDKYFQLIEQAKQYGYDVTELEKRQQEELDKIKQDAADKELARRKNLADKSIEATKGGLQGIADLVVAFAGKSEAAQKKAFNTQKAMNIAMATIDTIRGAVSAFTGMTSSIPGPVGLALGAVAAAGVVASGIANVKKIASTQFGGGTPSPSGGSAPSAPSTSTNAATPNVNLFGQNNNANNLSTPQSEESTSQQMVVKAVVVESDITNAQTKANKYQNLASL